MFGGHGGSQTHVEYGLESACIIVLPHAHKKMGASEFIGSSPAARCLCFNCIITLLRIVVKRYHKLSYQSVTMSASIISWISSFVMRR